MTDLANTTGAASRDASRLSDQLGMVERLRFLASGRDDPQSVALAEAADEIERLRCTQEEATDLAGHYMAQRDEERGRMARAVLALGLASQCIHAASSDHWASFDRLSDDFDDAMAEVMNAAGAVTITPAAMRRAVSDADKAVTVDSCGNCLTPDACNLRGQCGHDLRHGA